MKTGDIAAEYTRQADEAGRQVVYELLSGASGLLLAAFMWGHMMLVGSILTGASGFDRLAGFLERYYVAQPTVAIVLALFFVHAVFASRKIPSGFAERRRLRQVARALARSGSLRGSPARHRSGPPHVESSLWIWQVRTGLIILVLGSFHVLLLGLDVLTPLFGVRSGIEAVTSVARVRAGLWLPYGMLLVCVEFHASVGLYRLAVKWGAGKFLGRRALRVIESALLWFFLGFGLLILLVLGGIVPPPLAFLLPGAGE